MGRKNRGRRCRLRFRTLIRWPWYFESCPVTPGELILRLIPSVYYNPLLPESPIQDQSFRPNKDRDTDGISFSRLDFVTRKQRGMQARKPGAYIATLKVADLIKLGLNPIPSPIPDELPGHVVIPELSFANYEADKTKYKPILLELAKLAAARPLSGPYGNSKGQAERNGPKS